ncbi:hypothetical protein Tel_13060 [Candidatus Tenderia electrophaga]|jgi:uncharacterized membrane protein YvbJ|uniref:Putative zinc-ribbon domain-containing protein n=1 Tax=Candidatus Tenderia electrophaga TaxID=1748243 RepID=A0A0S2TFP2_9GAMM|nr:hypothetical protein Tel_13060 [Candidatus Tenderia electrophaga]
MALIDCPECGKKVSDAATSCPNCGIGIASARETQAAGTPLTTIQETGKRLKLHTIGAVLLLLVGAIWFFSQPTGIEQHASPWPPLLMFLGLTWYLVTKLRIWWHHK